MDNTDRNKDNNEILIENKYIVTENLFKSWTKDNIVVKRFKIFWIAMSILFIAMAIFCIVLNRVGDAIYLALVGLYCIYRGLYRNNLVAKKRYNMLVDLYKKNDWERRVVFYNDYFETIDENINKLRFEYNDIINVENECNYLKIKMSSGYIRVYKDSFVKSSIEECEKFLSSKNNDIKMSKI